MATVHTQSWKCAAFVWLESPAPTLPFSNFHNRFIHVQVKQGVHGITLIGTFTTYELSLSKIANVSFDESKIVLDLPNGDRIKLYGVRSDEFALTMQDLLGAILEYNDAMRRVNGFARQLRHAVQHSANLLVRSFQPGAFVPRVPSPPPALSVPDIPLVIKIDKKFLSGQF